MNLKAAKEAFEQGEGEQAEAYLARATTKARQGIDDLDGRVAQLVDDEVRPPPGSDAAASWVPIDDPRLRSSRDISIGSCFNVNIGADGRARGFFTVPCWEPHALELFGRGEVDSRLSNDPDADTLAAEGDRICRRLFEEYVGLDYNRSEFHVLGVLPRADRLAPRPHHPLRPREVRPRRSRRRPFLHARGRRSSTMPPRRRGCRGSEVPIRGDAGVPKPRHGGGRMTSLPGDTPAHRCARRGSGGGGSRRLRPQLAAAKPACGCRDRWLGRELPQPSGGGSGGPFRCRAPRQRNSGVGNTTIVKMTLRSAVSRTADSVRPRSTAPAHGRVLTIHGGVTVTLERPGRDQRTTRRSAGASLPNRRLETIRA